MKSKILKISAVFVTSILMCLCLTFAFRKDKIESVNAAEVVANEVANGYLWTGDLNDPIKAPEAGITLGTTSGYGRFVLDAENVTLEATAGENSGYKIVGWHVVYKDSERIDEWAYIHNTVANPKLKDKNNNDQGVVITYENSNRKSTFKLDKVFEDLVVAPVYDYIEYTIDISNFEGKLKTNPVVSTYKLGEEVSLTFNFKDELVLDLTKVKLNGDDLTSKTSNEGLGVGQFYKAQNNNNVTTGFEVKIKIADTADFNNILEIETDNLYKVTLNVTVDNNAGYSVNKYTKLGEEPIYEYNGEFYQVIDFVRTPITPPANLASYLKTENHPIYYRDLLGITTDVRDNKMISVSGAFSKIDGSNYEFYVKKADEFKIKCEDSYFEGIYNYFNFKALAGESLNNKTYYNVINADTTINVEYEQAKAQINYQLAIYKNNTLQTKDTGLSGEIDPTELAFGTTSYSVPNSIVNDVSNVGYYFVGFKDSDNATVPGNLNVSIKNIQPANVTVYVCFAPITYTIQISDFNKSDIKLADGTKAIQHFVVNGTKVSIAAGTSLTLGEVKIGETKTITAVKNKGFEVSINELVDNQLVLTAGLIEDLKTASKLNETIVDGKVVGTITLSTTETLKEYTYTYIIKKSKVEEDVWAVMANISAEINGEAKGSVVNYPAGASDDDAEGKQIILTLHYADQVKLISKALDADYNFRWFSYNNNQMSATEVEEDGQPSSYYMVDTVGENNKTIYVTYSIKAAMFFVVQDINDPKNALDFTAVSTNAIGGDNTNGYLCNMNDDITITLGSGFVKFGYKITGVTLMNGDADATSVSGLLYGGNTITFKAQDDVQKVVVKVAQIKYNFKINGAEDPVEVVVLYDDDSNGVAMLEYTKPEGQYVVSAVGVDDAISTCFVETNSYVGENSKNYSQNVYSSLQTLVSSGKAVYDNGNYIIELELIYSYYTFEVEFEMLIGGVAGTGVQYPAVQYVHNSEPVVELGTEGNSSKLDSIPYNAMVSLVYNKEIPVGYKFVSYEMDGNEYVDVAGFKICDEIKKNYTITINIEKITYNIKYTYTSESADMNPTSDDADHKVQFGDSFKLNPQTPVGYMCSIYTYGYVEAEINADNWEEKKENLYIFNGAYYQKVSGSAEYDITGETTYYQRERVKLINDEIANFKLGSKDDEIKEGETYYVEYYFEYKLIRFTINNKFDGYEIILRNAGINDKDEDGFALGEDIANARKIAYEDYGTITIKKNGTEVSADTTFTIEDTIYISIALNEEYEYGTAKYNLSAGLNVYMKVGNQEKGQISSITLEMDKNNNIDLVDLDRLMLDVTWKFEAKGKIMVAKMNLVDSGFNENATLEVSEQILGYGNSQNQGNPVTSTMKFLQKSQTAYNFIINGSQYNKYFKIDSFEVNIDGTRTIVTENQYKTSAALRNTLNGYGIYPTWKDYTAGKYTHRIINNVNVRYIFDKIEIVYHVVPILYFEGEVAGSDGHTFVKKLSLEIERDDGSVVAIKGKSPEFTTSAEISKSVDVTYAKDVFEIVLMRAGDTYVDGYQLPALGVGVHELELKIKPKSGYTWAENMSLPYDVYVEVLKADVEITYNDKAVNDLKLGKEYNGNSNFVGDFDKLLDCIQFVINGEKISYGELKQLTEGYKLGIKEGLSLEVTQTTKDGQVGAILASSSKYNVYVMGIDFVDENVRRDFNFDTTSIIMKNVYTINKRKIEMLLPNLNVVNNKVYDATTSATLKEGTIIGLNNIVSGDGTYIDTLKVELLFDTANIGLNKIVTIDASKALCGDFAENYEIKTAQQTANVYPYTISVKVADFGNISVYNRRGLTNPEYAGLLSLDAYLEVEVIYPESSEYMEVFNKIEGHISRTNTFVVGYRVNIIENGVKKELDSNLFLGLPNVKDLTKMLSLNEDGAESVNFIVENGEILLDLSSVPNGFDSLVLTQYKPLLPLWQIILIASAGVLVVGGVVTTVVVVRIKRKRMADANDII